MKRSRVGKRAPRLPRIAPCRDPLHLWYVEYKLAGVVWRRYFGTRHEARAGLRRVKAGEPIDAPR